MVLTLAIPLRSIYKLQDFITVRHLENMAKITLVTGLIVVYGYACEAFFGWYSGNEYERFMMKNRIYYGPYAWTYWLLLICNFIVPQILLSKRLRRSVAALFVVAMFINVGMWLERFVIIVTSLHRDFVPSSWDMYYPTIWDFMTLFGTIGLFTTLMFLFVRVLPLISIFEVRTLLPEAQVKQPAGGRPPVMEGGSH
jgi:molybdopterin-containing oxidoreductase family membrane subunit